MEQSTYVMIKPDAVARGLVGRVISRFEEAGLKLERTEFGHGHTAAGGGELRRARGQAVLRGAHRLHHVRAGHEDGRVRARRRERLPKAHGRDQPAEAAPGTIRGDFGLVLDANIVHGSDSPESAEREIAIFFWAVARLQPSGRPKPGLLSRCIVRATAGEKG